MKKNFIDLDNTLCRSENSDYINSTPITERIEYINNLKESGNHITIWTARGSKSGINHRDLTLRQLEEWNIKYDDLLIGKQTFLIFLFHRKVRF